jgi:hypothetical protein
MQDRWPKPTNKARQGKGRGSHEVYAAGASYSSSRGKFLKRHTALKYTLPPFAKRGSLLVVLGCTYVKGPGGSLTHCFGHPLHRRVCGCVADPRIRYSVFFSRASLGEDHTCTQAPGETPVHHPTL